MNGQFLYGTFPYYMHSSYETILLQAFLRYGTLIHFEDYKDTISNKY